MLSLLFLLSLSAAGKSTTDEELEDMLEEWQSSYLHNQGWDARRERGRIGQRRINTRERGGRDGESGNPAMLHIMGEMRREGGVG